jgi:hypothetical protein
MIRIRKILQKISAVIKYASLPILASVFPIFFHYSNNLGNLGLMPFSQLGNLFSILLLISIATYAFFYLISWGHEILASFAGFIFIILFNIYGLIFNWLRKIDIFQVDHYLLIPVFTLFAIYFSWIISKRITAKFSKGVWNASVIIVGVLILFNLGKIIPYEIKNRQPYRTNTSNASITPDLITNKNSPDIYFLIFDEFAGFDSMRNYWKYDEIDTFVNFLKSKGFFIAENSHADVPSTLPEISTRLNYEVITTNGSDKQIYYDAINQNKVMQYLKDRGYTTIVFNGLYYAWTTPQTIVADYSFQPTETYTGGYLNNEFELLVLKNTMVLPFLYNEKQDDPVAVRNRSMIFYTVNKLTQLQDIPTPKFIYVHLMFPHGPFLFDSIGKPIESQFYWDWDYYLGNYIYTTSVIRNLMTSLLSSYDPAHPPVIILQSDHGARNGPDGYTNYLKDYPEEYRTLIMNALYLPGCDTSSLTNDLKPINTFPVIFNCYFDANIPIK